MEAKLRAYRIKKSREEAFEQAKTKIKHLFKRMVPLAAEEKVDSIQQEDVAFEVTSETSETSSLDDKELCDPNTWGKFMLYGSLWVFLFILAIHVEFGAVYFAISLLYIIWANTRTSAKRPGEVSAYSVFNPNCEAIDGTLNAEQFEREIRYGALH